MRLQIAHTARRVYPVLSWGQTGALIIHVCLLFHTIPHIR